MDEVIEEIISIPCVYSCSIVSYDGIVIKSVSKTDMDEELLSALIAKIAKDVINKIEIKKNVLTTIKGSSGFALMVTKENFIVGVVTSSDVNIGDVKIKMKEGAKILEGIL